MLILTTLPSARQPCLAETPAAVSAKMRFGAPVSALRAVLKNDEMVRVLGLVLEAPEPPKTAPKMAQDEPLKMANLS